MIKFDYSTFFNSDLFPAEFLLDPELLSESELLSDPELLSDSELLSVLELLSESELFSVFTELIVMRNVESDF